MAESVTVVTLDVDSRPDANRAARLADKFTLNAIRIASLRAEMTQQLTSPSQLGFAFLPFKATWAIREQSLNVAFSFSLRLSQRSKEPKSEQRLGLIKVGFVAAYHIKQTLSDQERLEVTHYVGVITFLHLWPYFRSEVQAITTKVGLPALTLPVMVSGHAAKFVQVTEAAPPEPTPTTVAPETAPSETKTD